MNLLSVKMFFLAPYYRWKVRSEYLKNMKIRSKSEILDKKKEFEAKFLMLERMGNKDSIKYDHYLTVLKWLINEKVMTCLLILILATQQLYAQQEVKISPTYEKFEYIDDKTANNCEYFGWALIGTAYSAARWKIMKITYTGNNFVVQFADGDTSYNNKISEYALYTYN